VERWLAPVLNYIPGAEPAPVAVPAPANDELATHPPGCNCAVHLMYRGKKVGAK
jgi:5-methyltetrahydrofolate--homocysteine methyltransferase